MRKEDARAFLEVHRASVRGIAAKDYSRAVVESWAPLPITETTVARFLENPDDEVRLVAETDDKIIGIGALVLDRNELRACYVAPEASHRGVGSALVQEIERVALGRGLVFLQMDSSITAEPFYRALGYEVRERGQHKLASGQSMACVKMGKRLTQV